MSDESRAFDERPYSMPDLVPGETVLVRTSAFRVSKNTPSFGMSGRLSVTNRRVIFYAVSPTLFRSLAKTIVVDAPDILSVRVRAKSWHNRSWFARREIRITQRDGTAWRFRVYRADRVSLALEQLTSDIELF